MSRPDPCPKPFAGLRILDFSRVLAGPFCTAMLADLGAEIIKVEPPGGDDQRAMGAFQDGVSVNFELINRGKRSLRLDLKQPAAQRLARDLAARCDVVVENFRPGVADKLGIGYEALREVRADLVYCSISGFGQTGPLAQHPSYDVIAQAASGLMSLTGQADGDPVLVGDSVGDTVSGLFAAFGISAALYRRARTGMGGRVDIAMFDALFALLPTALAQLQVTGRAPGRSGAVHPLSAPFGAYRASDRPFMVAIANNSLFERFAALVGAPGLGCEPRFASDRLRRENEAELRRIIEDWAAGMTAAEAVGILAAAGIPASEIWTVKEAAESAHAAHRGLTASIDTPRIGRLNLPEQPIHLSGLTRGNLRPAPALGEHGSEILADILGLSEADIAGLAADRVI
jgi:CoA:oxalate CoA-transferase